MDAENNEIDGKHFKVLFNRGATIDWICENNVEDKEAIESISNPLSFDEFSESLKG